MSPAADDLDFGTKQVFTTGEAADICNLSQQTIIRCFDTGRLQGFRVPGSRFRRIPREGLIKFMKDNNIPLDRLDGGSCRVLVVDDDPEIIELFKEIFGRDNRLEVKTATTGYDAGVLTEQFKPHLILLDFMLPDINGNVVCKTIRENPGLNGIKIVMVSGVVKQEEVDGLLKAGADEFIKKPFHIDQLLERVHALLEL